MASAYRSHGQNRNGYTPLNIDVSKQCVVQGLSNINKLANDVVLLGIAAKQPKVVVAAEIIKMSSDFALTALGEGKSITQIIRDTAIDMTAPNPFTGEGMQQINLLPQLFSQYYYLYAIVSILVLLMTGKKVFEYLTCAGYD